MRAPGGAGARSARLLLAAGLTLVGLLAVVNATVGGEPPAQRVVAVGDVHGSFDGLVNVLAATGLIDDQLRWTGGNTVLVQIGDLLDRGVEVRPVLDLMMRLQAEAAEAGGRVVCLLGNHEGMNLLGIRRDVDPGAYAAFADGRSEARQKGAWDELVRYYRARARHFDQPPPQMNRSVKARWMELNPPGAVEYMEALGPDGAYGRWVRSLPAAVRVGEVLFVHGGLGPDLKGLDVATINRKVAEDFAQFDRLKAYMVAEGLTLPEASVADMARVAEKEWEAFSDPSHRDRSAHQRHAEALRPLLDWKQWMVASAGGPIWFRGAAYWDEVEHDGEMASLLDGIGVRWMVVGHTVQRSGQIQARFGGRVLLIDTGMLSSYYQGGRASALEVVDGSFTAVYLDRRVPLDLGEAPAAAEDGQP